MTAAVAMKIQDNQSGRLLLAGSDDKHVSLQQRCPPGDIGQYLEHL